MRRKSRVERRRALSPGDDWVAYVDEESGQPDVYVDRFPQLGNRVRISTDGGEDPHWSTDGSELFYLHEDWMMAITINFEGASIRPDAPEPLFQLRGVALRDGFNNYDVDGERFLIRQLEKGAVPRPEIRVVTNWFEELERLAPHPK